MDPVALAWLGLVLVCGAPQDGVTVETTPAALRAVSAEGERLDGLTVLLEREAMELAPDVLAVGGRVGLVTDVSAPAGTTVGMSLVVLHAPPGGALAERRFVVRRAVAAARAAHPCAAIRVRATADDPLRRDPHVVAAVDGLETVVSPAPGPAGLLQALPESGRHVTLRLADAAGVRELQRVRQLLPEPWFRDGDVLGNATGRRLRAVDGRLVASEPGEAHAAHHEDVVAEAEPSAAELLVRHQAAIARREHTGPRLVSRGLHVVVFEVPGLSAPVTLDSQVTLEESPGRRSVAHRELRMNGLALGHVPRLPLLGGEGAGPAPLGLTVDEAFAYRALGRERRDGLPTFVLGFRPRARADLPSGRAWLHAGSFELVRLETVWPGRQGPFVSTRQVEERRPHGPGGRWVTTRILVDQVYDAAGHRTPVHRELRLSRHEEPTGNALPTAVEVQVPLAPPASVLAAAVAPAGDMPRPSSRVRTVAAGVLLDPGIDRPLPFVGGSWAELDLLGTGTQLQAQLGGAFARMAWTVPELGSPRWQLRAEGAVALVEYNDRAFRDGVERYDENLRQRPARATVLLERRLGGRVRARVGYELGFTRLRAGAGTGPTFRLPRSPLSHGLRAELHGERGPWSALGWTVAARRASWRAWGYEGGEGEAPARDSLRGGVSLSRLVLARPRAQARLQVEAMGGRGLDRFNRFGFDALENRLQGYATNALRHEGAVVVRAAVSATPSPRLRLAAFADGARVRASSARDGAGSHGGAGLSLETPVGPLVLAAEWARSLAAPFREGPAGRDVVRLTLFGAF
jgi:hypothetical protein